MYRSASKCWRLPAILKVLRFGDPFGMPSMNCSARRAATAAAAPPGPAGGKAPHRIWAEFLHRYSRETPGARAEKVNERGRDDEARSRDSSMAVP